MDVSLSAGGVEDVQDVSISTAEVASGKAKASGKGKAKAGGKGKVIDALFESMMNSVL
jgi:hypothetical protein